MVLGAELTDPREPHNLLARVLTYDPTVELVGHDLATGTALLKCDARRLSHVPDADLSTTS